MRRTLPVFAGIVLFSFLFFTFIHHSKNASAAAATHVVISEVQVGGVGVGTTSQDFVELYNPTSSDVSLDGMRLGKKTSGTSSANVVIFASGATVPAHGFFLWCNTSLTASLTCDASGSGTMANHNSLALINGSLAAGTVVDAVTFGTPGGTFGEGASLTAPIGGTSVERKANSTSDTTKMGVGGLDEFAGNGEDTDDNATDFVFRTTPQPQNSQSSVEPAASTPTLTPTMTPTPTLEPTATPTQSPTPTLSPAPSATPTPVFSMPKIACSRSFKTIHVFNFQVLFPIISCGRI